MIQKIHTYLQSGGLNEVIGYVFIRLKKAFYYKSETIFFFLDRQNHQPFTVKSDIIFKTIKKVEDLRKIDFDRIKTLNYEEWFKKGSLAIVGFSSSKPVSFTWTHFHSHRFENLFELNLSDNKCWTGPSFVDKTMRGRGINQAQKNYQIINCPKNIQYLITSANAKNYPSIRTLEKAGFKHGLTLIKYYGVLTKKKDEIICDNKYNSIFQFR